jgi:hypothetical protein
LWILFSYEVDSVTTGGKGSGARKSRGTLPLVDGKLAISGRLGANLSVDQGREAARLASLNALGPRTRWRFKCQRKVLIEHN